MAHELAGKRVEIPPSYDLWMRGARYGTITNVLAHRGVGRVAYVRMDNRNVRKLVRVPLEDLKFVDYRRTRRRHGNQMRFSHETRTTPHGYHETGIVEHEGRRFSAGGGGVDTHHGVLVGYPKRVATGSSRYRQGRFILTTFSGHGICALQLRGTHTQRGFHGSKTHMHSWSCKYGGHWYSGRNSGEGMLLRLRRGRAAR